MSLTSSLLSYTTNLKAKLEKIISDKDIFGSGGTGTYHRNIFKGTIRTLNPAIDIDGDFPSNDGGMADDYNVYVHFRLPFNTLADNEMFWLKIKGYAFGSSQIINTTVVGYSYVPQNDIINKQINSIQTAELYKDTNGNAVVSLLFPHLYYVTLEIDSMRAAVGKSIKRGDIQVKYSKSTRVLFT